MDIATFLSYICVTSFTPGPNNIISMTNGINGGVKKALPYALGVFVGTGILLSLAAFFGSVIFNAIPAVATYMKILGSAYILYLAYVTLRDKPKKKKSFSLDTDRFSSAVLLQFINVKAYLYAITTMSTFILPYYRGLSLAGFTLLLATVALVSNLCWAAFGSVFDHFFKSHKKALNVIMALLLVYCAIKLWR